MGYLWWRVEHGQATITNGATLDKVWYILPASKLLPLNYLSCCRPFACYVNSQGLSNFNAGKLDRTWSRAWVGKLFGLKAALSPFLPLKAAVKVNLPISMMTCYGPLWWGQHVGTNYTRYFDKLEPGAGQKCRAIMTQSVGKLGMRSCPQLIEVQTTILIWSKCGLL